jgi:hypothetical protein
MRMRPRDDNDIAFHQLAYLAALDRIAAQFVWRGLLRVKSHTASDQCRGAVEHVDHVGILRMDLRLAWLSAPATAMKAASLSEGFMSLTSSATALSFPALLY